MSLSIARITLLLNLSVRLPLAPAPAHHADLEYLDEDYRRPQTAIVNRPHAGPAIPGSGGLRKVRWGLSGRGKRGGVRMIYYWAVEQQQLLMLFAFTKHERDDLSLDQVKILRRIVEDEYP